MSGSKKTTTTVRKEEAAKMEKFEPCIITKEFPEPPGTSHHVGISQENYAKLMDISGKTGRSLRWLCNYMLEYAFQRVKIED